MSHVQQQDPSVRKTLRWTSIKFLKHIPRNVTLMPADKIRFCEAVSRAAEGEWTLTQETVCCAGAQRCFGWLKGADRELAWSLAEKLGVNATTAGKAIADVPVLPERFDAVWVGTDTAPDVYVAYVLPETAMRLVRSWQRIYGKSLPIKVSGIMSVCGSAVVSSYVNHTISLTFGCPDSRRSGGIQAEQLVVAMPADLLTKMRELTVDSDTLFSGG
jgi:uncharacterized protein (DUF169 family)